MLFDTTHLLYILISSISSAILLVLLFVFVKKYETKVVLLKIFAILTILIHYSSLWVDYFSTGTADVPNTMLLPIYPCNVSMWLLLILAFISNKKSKFFAFLAEFTFYLGVVGGILGIVLNENYAGTPDLTNFEILKGLLSHTLLIIGCFYLFSGGFIKIRVKNVLSVFVGMLVLLADGYLINWLFSIFSLPEVNSMYLLHVPFPELPWLNTFSIGAMGLGLVFLITAFYELLFLKKGERWTDTLKNFENRRKNI
jgi:hypothetical protein